MLTNWPNTDRETCRTSPVPLQTGQVTLELDERAPVPLQVSHRLHFFIFSRFSTPVAISSRVSFRRIFRSEPGVALEPRERVRGWPPNISSNNVPPMPPPKISLKVLKMSLMSVNPRKSVPRMPS